MPRKRDVRAARAAKRDRQDFTPDASDEDDDPMETLDGDPVDLREPRVVDEQTKEQS